MQEPLYSWESALGVHSLIVYIVVKWENCEFLWLITVTWMKESATDEHGLTLIYIHENPCKLRYDLWSAEALLQHAQAWLAHSIYAD